MEVKDFLVSTFDGKQIVLRGIGKMYYQDGFPIDMGADLFIEKGYEVSWLHLADELLKHGWTNKRVLNTIENAISNTKYQDQLSLIQKFVESEYEEQREMIFDYLFKDKNEAIDFFNNNIKIN